MTQYRKTNNMLLKGHSYEPFENYSTYAGMTYSIELLNLLKYWDNIGHIFDIVINKEMLHLSMASMDQKNY